MRRVCDPEYSPATPTDRNRLLDDVGEPYILGWARKRFDDQMTPREVERELRDAGAVLEKKDGDHHVWRLRSGRTFIVPFGGKHCRDKGYLEAKLKKLLGVPADGKAR